MSNPFIIVNPVFQAFVKGTDLPLVGGLVQFYLAGTTTPQPVYPTATDAMNNTNPLPNPVVLDANGRMDGIYGNSIYDVYISDSNSVLQDTILSVSWSPAVSAGGITTEWEPVATSFTFVDAKTFTVPGNQTSIFIPSRRIQTTNTAGIITGTIISSTFSSSPNHTTIVVENDSGILDSGLSVASVDILSIPRGTPIDPLPTLSGGTTAYTVSVQQAPKIAGAKFSAIVNITNTGASTLVVNGNSGVAITKQGGTALVAGDLQINEIAEFQYDGTEWQLLNPYIVSNGQFVVGSINGNVLQNASITATQLAGAIGQVLQGTGTAHSPIQIVADTVSHTGTVTSWTYTLTGAAVFPNAILACIAQTNGATTGGSGFVQSVAISGSTITFYYGASVTNPSVFLILIGY